MVHFPLGIELSKLGGFELKDTRVPHLKKWQPSGTELFKLKAEEYIPSYYNKTLPSKPRSKQTIASQHIVLHKK